MVQVLKGPDRHQGRTPVDAGQLAGRLLVHLPQEKHIGISQRIEDEGWRASARASAGRAGARRRAGRLHRAHHGRIRHRRRTAADIAYLRSWRDPGSTVGPVPADAASRGVRAGQRTLRDLADRRDRTHHRVDLAGELPELAPCAEYTPQLVSRCSSTTAASAAVRPARRRGRDPEALARRVDLKSGGYLIIDQTEAMTTVDVNTGGFVGRAISTTPSSRPTSRRQDHRPPAAPAQPRRHHHHRLIDMENVEHREWCWRSSARRCRATTPR